MNPKDIWTLYTMELRSALRERSIVVYSILLPIFLYPVMLWVMFSAMTFIQGVNEGFTSRIALIGDAPEGHGALLDSLEARPNVELRREEEEEEEAVALIREGELDAILSFSPAPEGGEALPGNFAAGVRFDRSESRSRTARERIEEEIEGYRDAWMIREAGDLGLTGEDRVVFTLASEDVSTEEDLGAFLLGMILPLFLIFMVAMGCFYPAVDTTAGERERSTWETLMTTSAARIDVVAAKYFYVATMGVTAGILNVVAMFVSMGAIMAPLMGGEGGITFRIPILAVPVMIAGAVVIALMLSAGMMILAAFARSFKDGQAMIQPVYLAAVFIPLLVGQQTDQTLTASLAALPIANVVMMIRDAINGIFLWPFILESLAVNLVVVGLCLLVARWVLQFEDFLMGSFDGSFWRFIKGRARRGRAGKESA